MKTDLSLLSKELQAMSDSELVASGDLAVQEERNATSVVIEHLREINRRKLYSDFGCSSIHRYCMKRYKMSEGSAQRRVDAMRLSDDIPEAREKLESGDLSLSVASRLQSFVRQEGKLIDVPLQKVKELVSKTEGLSSRATERVLLKHSIVPERHIPEKVRPVSQTHHHMSFTVSDEDLELLNRVKGLLAHTHPNLNWSECVVAMAKITREKLDPARRTVSPTRAAYETQSRKPTAAQKHEVFKRDDSKCVKCGSFYALDADHKIPWAKGGQTSLENLRVLCSNCNQRERYRWFGPLG
jgi:5-methylcytosine-specific restriction endonuclease McrA